MSKKWHTTKSMHWTISSTSSSPGPATRSPTRRSSRPAQPAPAEQIAADLDRAHLSIVANGCASIEALRQLLRERGEASRGDATGPDVGKIAWIPRKLRSPRRRSLPGVSTRCVGLKGGYRPDRYQITDAPQLASAEQSLADGLRELKVLWTLPRDPGDDLRAAVEVKRRRDGSLRVERNLQTLETATKALSFATPRGSSWVSH